MSMETGFSSALNEKALRTPEEVQAWVTAHPGSAVWIIGSGIAGLILAETLVRHALGVPVVVVTGDPPAEKRMIDGCSLRRSTVVALADGMGVPPEQLFSRFRVEQSAFPKLALHAVDVRAGALQPLSEPIIVGPAPTPGLSGDYPIGLSTRHGEVLLSLRELVSDRVQLVFARVVSAESSGGSRLSLKFEASEGEVVLPAGHALFNTTPQEGLWKSAKNRTPRPAPRRVIVSQGPVRLKAGVPRVPAAWVPTWEGSRGPHVAIFTPFWDAGTPEATWYALNTRVSSAEETDSTAQAEALAEVREHLQVVMEAYGLEPLDWEQASFDASVPSVRDFDLVSAVDAPYFELYRVVSSGVPAVNTDGMLAQALGARRLGLVLAERHREGWHTATKVAAQRTKRELRPVRWWNAYSVWVYYFAPLWLRRRALGWSTWMLPKMVKDWAFLGLNRVV